MLYVVGLCMCVCVLAVRAECVCVFAVRAECALGFGPPTSTCIESLSPLVLFFLLAKSRLTKYKCANTWLEYFMAPTWKFHYFLPFPTLWRKQGQRAGRSIYRVAAPTQEWECFTAQSLMRGQHLHLHRLRENVQKDRLHDHRGLRGHRRYTWCCWGFGEWSNWCFKSRSLRSKNPTATLNAAFKQAQTVVISVEWGAGSAACDAHGQQSGGRRIRNGGPHTGCSILLSAKSFKVKYLKCKCT